MKPLPSQDLLQWILKYDPETGVFTWKAGIENRHRWAGGIAGKRVQRNNRSGLKGAYYHACHKGKKWRSQIRFGNVLHFLGYFHTAEEAHAAYRKASLEMEGEFSYFARDERKSA